MENGVVNDDVILVNCKKFLLLLRYIVYAIAAGIFIYDFFQYIQTKTFERYQSSVVAGQFMLVFGLFVSIELGAAYLNINKFKINKVIFAFIPLSLMYFMGVIWSNTNLLFYRSNKIICFLSQ